MKNKVLLISSVLLLLCISMSSKDVASNTNLNQSDSTSIVSSPELLDLTNLWAREFNSINSSAKIKVLNSSDVKTSSQNIHRSLRFYSRESSPGSEKGSSWKEVIGRDIIVPIINSNNPMLTEVNRRGISSRDMALALSQADKRNWKTLLGTTESSSINYYGINDLSIKTKIVNFLETGNVAIKGIEVANGKELVSAIQKDPSGIGFCRLSEVLDPGSQQMLENISLMPIDRNFNGKVDYNEDIYNNLNAFTRGVWIGKYPKALFSNIYAGSASQPSNEIEVAFMKWILTDGQQFVNSQGYSDLCLTERQTKVDELVTGNIDIPLQKNDKARLKIILLILAIFIAISFALEAVFSYIRKHKSEKSKTSPISIPVFNENSIATMNGLYFDKTHTWAYMKKNGLVKIGIDDFLQHVTGKITQIKMKKAGEKIVKGEPVLSIIHNGKQLNINSPVSGIIKEQNELLNCRASIVNASPYSDGWIYSVEPTNWMKEIQSLFLGERYMNWLKEEFSRLRDFLAVYSKNAPVECKYVIIQDGGEITDNPLSNLGPEVWEEFQVKFIDTLK